MTPTPSTSTGEVGETGRRPSPANFPPTSIGTRVSLNFAPFAALLAPEADLSTLQSVERRAFLALKGHFQLDNLLLVNRKFFPGWRRRFVVYERRRDLPRVAALAAEAYLPFTGRDPT